MSETLVLASGVRAGDAAPLAAADLDFGTEPCVVADPRLSDALSGCGYRRSEGT